MCIASICLQRCGTDAGENGHSCQALEGFFVGVEMPGKNISCGKILDTPFTVPGTHFTRGMFGRPARMSRAGLVLEHILQGGTAEQTLLEQAVHLVHYWLACRQVGEPP